jgi:hypothetical protein
MFEITGLPQRFYKRLQKLDYTLADKNCRLVLSREGTFIRNDPAYLNKQGELLPNSPFLKYGLASRAERVYKRAKYLQHGLRQAMWELGCAPTPAEGLDLTFQTSSVCVYTPRFLNNFHRRLLFPRPDDPLYMLKTPRKGVYETANAVPDIKVIYPTQKTVETSLEGRHMTCSRMTKLYYEEGKFKEIAYDADAKRPGLISHNKILSGVIKHRKAGARETRGFMLIGSHNFTKAAFGRIRDPDVSHALALRHAR